MDTFVTYLSSRATFSPKEMQQILAASTLLRLHRKDLLLRQGEVCRGYAFVNKGCFRLYRIGGDGAEHILRFAIENWWMSDMESVDLRQPSKCTIEALEDSEVLFWTKEDMGALTQKIPALGVVCDQLKLRNQHVNEQRIFAALSYTAEEKYHEFITTYPDLFNRVPLHMVASYLGITRKTISRIRAKDAHPHRS